MNVTDRAFIKAYAWDRSEPSPPAPHLAFVPVVGAGSAALSDASQSSARGARSHTATVEPPQRRPEKSTLPKFADAPAAKSAEVTHFVPAPHLPLAGSRVSRTSERQPLNFGAQKSETLEQQLAVNNAQPLSTFTQSEPVSDTFEPALGVPGFQWPETCDRLDQFFPPDCSAVLELLAARQGDYAPVIAVSGARRGEGRSTALLCLGRELARSGRRTIMVDGDFARPALAEQLGLETSTGWEDVLTGQILLSEAIIYAEQEGLSLLPLGETVRDRHAMASALHVTISLAVLSQHYDAVLVDTGPLCDEPSAAATMLRRAKFTGALLVHDTRTAAEQGLLPAIARLAELHVPLLGVVENFGGNMGQSPWNDKRTAAA